MKCSVILSRIDPPLEGCFAFIEISTEKSKGWRNLFTERSPRKIRRLPFNRDFLQFFNTVKVSWLFIVWDKYCPSLGLKMHVHPWIQSWRIGMDHNQVYLLIRDFFILWIDSIKQVLFQIVYSQGHVFTLFVFCSWISSIHAQFFENQMNWQTILHRMFQNSKEREITCQCNKQTWLQSGPSCWHVIENYQWIEVPFHLLGGKSQKRMATDHVNFAILEHLGHLKEKAANEAQIGIFFFCLSCTNWI